MQFIIYYLLDAETKQLFTLLKTSFCCLHTEAASTSLREFVKLPYKCVYLSKMAPLKLGCSKFGVLWVKGVCREVYGMKEVKREGTPTWEYLTVRLCMPPTIIVGG